MPFRLVIFDLDGTLLNTIADLASAVNAALKANGFSVRSKKECESFVGNGIGKLIERALPEGYQTDDNTDKVKKSFLSFYDEHLTDATRPYVDIENMLIYLQQAGVSVAVASNKYQSATEKLVTYFFPEIRFIKVLGQREGIAPKPNPAVIEEILSLGNFSKNEVLYVGDSEVDIQTAKAGGIPVCAVTWGFRKAETLKKYLPDFLVHTPAQIVDLVTKNLR